jgi:hypothetical protein
MGLGSWSAMVDMARGWKMSGEAAVSVVGRSETVECRVDQPKDIVLRDDRLLCCQKLPVVESES